MTIRVIKVVPAVYPPDAGWHVYDESGVIDELVEPDAWMRDWVGARQSCYLRAEKTVDGWLIKGRYKGRKLYW